MEIPVRHVVEIEVRRLNFERGSCCATFLVHFPTMTSRAGREIMNSKVAGSMPTVILTIRKRKKGISHVLRTCKTHLEYTQKER